MEVRELCAWSRQGLIPGPNETESQFKQRVDFCLRLKSDFLKEVSIPHSDLADEKMLEPVFQLTESLYGIRPNWVPIFFSNWKLKPWHGGAAWIFQLKQEGPLGSLLQLRKPFYRKSRYLGIYERDELMAHEMAHVGRMAFEEKKFEELLAYRSSKKDFSRYFGPIIQSAFESRLIIYLIATLLLMDGYFLFQGAFSFYLATQWFKLIPLCLIAFAFFRLQKRQRTLKRAEKNIPFPHASAILYRLTDAEIELFAQSSPEQIKAYVEKQSSLRWRAIRTSTS